MKQTRLCADKKMGLALKAKSHHLKPVVTIGQKGWHEALHKELEAALDHHELMKLKLAGDREARDRLVGILLEQTGAILIQRIGNTVTIYRQKTKIP